MSGYIYEATDEQRRAAQEIQELKQAEQVIKERLKALSKKLAVSDIKHIDFTDTVTGKHLYFQVMRRTTWEYDIAAIETLYPEHYNRVVKTVEDRPQLNRLIEAGLIEQERIGTPKLGDAYVGPVREWQESAG